ncbi:MAG TPA: imidazoleglycerol-phosphate dehydratase HisB [Acidimicrobiales bacterium]|nr:imidazoleglycerol-phosphate dehydratase HisB [Acidimicrobiales bacterium]
MAESPAATVAWQALAMMSSDGGDPVRRSSVRRRVTKETTISVALDIDGGGRHDVRTGLPFFDHMLSQLAKHGGFDLDLEATGDLEVDAHHTVEDTGILLGQCLAEALADRRGVRRFADVSIPLDEALVDVALDLSGRPYIRYEVEIPEDAAPLGQPGFDPQLAEEFWRAFATAAGITLHVEMRCGKNIHHILEASFKGVARALRDAVRVEGDSVPSTKGSLGEGTASL